MEKNKVDLFITEFRNEKVLITDFNRSNLPDDLVNNPELHVYDIRHSDDDFNEPTSVETKAIVNNWGTLISRVPLLDESREFTELTEDESSTLYNALFEGTHVNVSMTIEELKKII